MHVYNGVRMTSRTKGSSERQSSANETRPENGGKSWLKKKREKEKDEREREVGHSTSRQRLLRFRNKTRTATFFFFHFDSPTGSRLVFTTPERPPLELSEKKKKIEVEKLARVKRELLYFNSIRVCPVARRRYADFPLRNFASTTLLALFKLS